MLHFEREVLIADLGDRTIEGVIVPFDEVGTIQGRDYRFRRGSVTLGQRVPLLVDHDRGQPIGVLAELVDQPTGILARFRVDATPAGDAALVQAASGSRGALSIGADVVRSSMARDGVVDVEAALVLETSLLALGAFDSAAVTRVAAELDNGEEPEEPEEETPQDGEQETPEPAEVGDGQEELELAEPEHDDEAGAAGTDPEEEDDNMTTEATAAPTMILAERSPRQLSAGAYIDHLIRAQRGDPEARRFLEAALTETVSTDLAGILPPQYQAEIIGAKTVDRTLFAIFASRPLPGVGLEVMKPSWTTRPQGAWAADVDADATTSKAVIGFNSAAIERWDWATAVSYVSAQRSSPDAIATLYAEAVTDFHDDVETKIAQLTGGMVANAAATLGSGIAAFYQLNNRTPEVIIVAPDVWGDMADAKELDLPVGLGDDFVASGAGLVASYAGLPITASAHLGAGDRILATRRALDVRVSEPVRLTMNAIGALNVELAVVGEGLFDVDWPDEAMKLTPGAVMGASASSSSRSSKS